VEARVARFRKEPAGSSSPDIVSQAPRSSSVSAVLCSAVTKTMQIESHICQFSTMDRVCFNFL
jgi:hypothetical protein